MTDPNSKPIYDFITPRRGAHDQNIELIEESIQFGISLEKDANAKMIASMDDQVKAMALKSIDDDFKIIKLQEMLSRMMLMATGCSTALHHLSDKKPGENRFIIHESNIEYFTKLYQKFMDWDEEMFELGNFENGKFVFHFIKNTS